MRSKDGIHRLTFLVLAALAALSDVRSAEPRRLSLDDRIAAQKAIEQVYWKHRLWPKENPGPKPPLSAVMSDEAIRAKVEDYLKKSNALDTYWDRPVAAEQLQSELDRMAKHTRDGATLRELFAALGNDPFVIAETLARQTLVDRLIRNWYGFDSRFHGGQRLKADAALASCAAVECMKSMGAEYLETKWRLEGQAALDPEAWKAQLESLATKLRGAADALPIGRLSEIEETPDAFTVTTVLAQSEREVATASVTWRKRSFETWWREARVGLDTAVDPPVSMFVAPSQPEETCTNDSWSATRLDLMAQRDRHTAVWTGSEMIVWGGFQDGVFYRSGGRYDPATDTWTPTAEDASTPAARFRHAAVWTGSEMIVWGGGISGTYFTTGGRYDPASDTWIATSTGANVPAGRADPAAVWTGSAMIVWGGDILNVGFNTGGRYSPSSDTWAATSTGANCPSARYGHTTVWTGSSMIVWGGINLTEWRGDGARYNPTTDVWTPISGASAPSARHRHTAVWTGVHMIVWGGDAAATTGGRYSPATDTWTTTSTGVNVPTPRHEHTAIWTGSQMIVWGGTDDVAKRNDGGRYNPSTNSWDPISTGAGVPVGRTDHTAVWTGSEMIVWGGRDDAGQLNTGGRYLPASNTWVPTATGINVPSTRHLHTAVWTGSEMVVWGGTDISALNTGARYVPATDSWTATSTAAAVPNRRYHHTAAWTGSEMIVWGGFNGDALNTGGRYSPTTDTWSPTSTGGNCPSPRLEHTAVWGGREMTVWGGFDHLYLNTGGRYDPSTDTWVATSTGSNVPVGREGHVAVWAGNRMVIWGGNNGAYLNSGGIYVPAFNTWTPTSTGTNAPPAANQASAVWTGDEMIVWGGFNGSYLGSGGRLTPSTNIWSAISSGPSAPAARAYHRAVWTGLEMIVWGGSNGAALDSGGRYAPASDSWTATSIGPGVPTGRLTHTGVWTGSEMIVWGGSDGTTSLNSGGRYCGCLSTGSYFLDDDHDGYGNPAVSTTACNGVMPAGYVANNRDCNDAAGSIHPGATEINDGVDNQCPGDDGYGLIDEIQGTGGFSTPGDKTTISWPAQPGASSYDVARSPYRDLHAGCSITSAALPTRTDTGLPPPGGMFYYAIRVASPWVGSWGEGSSGAERTVCAGCETSGDQCDDGSSCTTGDVCQSGTCVGTVPGATNHLVISQIQTEGDGGTDDEFVELYNPTSSPIGLTGMSLQWKSNQGSIYAVHAFAGGVVPAHGWFLVARSAYNGSVPADQLNPDFAMARTVGNLVLLDNTTAISGSCPVDLTHVIDHVSYGTGACPEGTAETAPAPNDSIIRLPAASCGNGTDTNNNAADFVLQSPATPRNSASSPQP